jgi:predicted Fe-Mo cluster-binding NifX family protein
LARFVLMPPVEEDARAMKVALTVWDGRISPVFDVCREALIVTIENGTVVSRSHAVVDAPSAVLKVGQLADLGVETLVCGAISEPLGRELTEHGVRVIGFVAGEVETVVAAFVARRLPSPELSMPGCRDKKSTSGSR